MNQFSIFESLCSDCDNFEWTSSSTSASEQSSDHQELFVSLHENITADTSLTWNCSSKSSASKTQQLGVRNTLNAPLIVNNEEGNSNAFNLSYRGINISHLNIQGICGEKLGKFSEIKVLLTLPENNNLHILGLSETKLKDHKSTDVFKINGFQTLFRRDNDSIGRGGLLVYVKNDINARRREDLETHDISCIWLDISPPKGKSFKLETCIGHQTHE